MINQENKIKISNNQRISRILRRICQASLPVIVRGAGSTAVSVKGRAATIMTYGPNNLPVMRISNVSERGIAHLLAAQKVQVEFVMMATKVAFVSQIQGREEQSILVGVPQTLVSIERRKNARYNCIDELRAFINLSCWQPDIDDLTAPPFYPHYKDIAGYIPISDLSFGGFCAVTRFPSSSMTVRRGLIDDKSQLILPMIGTFNVGTEIRWIKRIKEHHKDPDGKENFKRFFKFGVEFVSQTEEVKLGIRQFITKLSQAGAI